ncbi:MAG: cadherin-like domain-containing protein, partial [bacterium]|nr:cadherin-like domain-containing protein [bacterium]
TFDVTSVNDAPAGANATVSLLEDSSYAFAMSDFTFSDPNDTPVNNLLAIRITTLPAGGSLTLSGIAVTAGQFIDPADVAAGLLVFTPVANGAGTNYSGFTFQLQDDGGTANGAFDLDQTPNRIQIDVTRINDAPSGTDRTITTLEDIPHVFTASNFGLTDVLDSPANTLLSVTINTLPLNGSLTLNGVAVTAGQVISAADIAAGRLAFLSALNDNGASYASFDFQVQDNGGTANGGVDFDATPNTITIDVTAVDDPPVVVANTGVTLLEGGTVGITTAQLSATDVDTPDANIIYTITQQPLHGRLELTTNPGATITSFTQAELAAGLIQYTHDGGETIADSFRFALRDGTTVLPSENFVITVTPVNDPPSDIIVTRTYFPENAPLGWHLSFLNAVDPDNATFTWSFVGSPSIFAINGNDLVVNAMLDYETTPIKSYTVTLQAFDGEYTYQETFTFDLLDTNEFVQPDEVPPQPKDDNGLPQGFGELGLLDNYILTTVRGIDFTGGDLQQDVDGIFAGEGGGVERGHGFDGAYGAGIAALDPEDRRRMHDDQKEGGTASSLYDDNPLFQALMRHAQKPAPDAAEKLTQEKDNYRKTTSQQLDDAARYYQSKHDALVRALMDETPKT